MRTAAGLHAALAPPLVDAPTVIVGFLEDDVVVNDFRLPRGSANMAGLLRDMRERKVEKITFARGVEVARHPRADGRARRSHVAHRGRRSPDGARRPPHRGRRRSRSRMTTSEQVGLDGRQADVLARR